MNLTNPLIQIMSQSETVITFVKNYHYCHSKLLEVFSDYSLSITQYLSYESVNFIEIKSVVESNKVQLKHKI